MWSISLPKKYLLLVWKLLCQAIPSTDILRLHHLEVDNDCQFGCNEDETILHIFTRCLFSRSLWSQGVNVRPPLFSSPLNFTEWLKEFFMMLDELGEVETLHKSIILLNLIWRKRNFAFHNHQMPSFHASLREIVGEYTFCKMSFQRNPAPFATSSQQLTCQTRNSIERCHDWEFHVQ